MSKWNRCFCVIVLANIVYVSLPTIAVFPVSSVSPFQLLEKLRNSQIMHEIISTVSIRELEVPTLFFILKDL